MPSEVRPFHPVTIAALQAEFLSAQVKHARRPCTRTDLPDAERLANLVEEVGEAAECLTYDKPREGLVRELIQAAVMALSWVEQEEYQVAQRDHAGARVRTLRNLPDDPIALAAESVTPLDQ